VVENLVEAQELFLLVFEEAEDGAVVFLPTLSWGKIVSRFAQRAFQAPV